MMMIPLESGDEVISTVVYHDYIMVFTRHGNCFLIMFDEATKHFTVEVL